MWKPLSIVSGVALLAGAGITYTQVRQTLVAERLQASNAEENKGKAEKNKADADAALKTAEAELTKIKDSLTKAERGKAEAAAKKEEASKLVEEATTSKDAASKDLAEQESKLKDLGGIDALVAELRAQEAKRLEYDKQLATAKAAIESSLAGKAALDNKIADLKRIDAWQQSGTMAPSFRSRITAVNPDWGFVTIGAGNSAAVTRQAKLDVVRGGSVVGKLVVTHVAPNSSSAEIVPGSVAPGDSILPGDQVKTGSSSLPGSRPAAPAPGSTPAPADKPAAEGVPDAAPPAPAAEADPFASPTPAADAPAPAADAPAADAPAVEPAAETPMGN